MKTLLSFALFCFLTVQVFDVSAASIKTELPWCENFLISKGANDTLQAPHSLFNHVGKVLIVTDFADLKENLNGTLSEKNLQNLLITIYQERFTPIEWCDSCKKHHCYGRNSQEVTIVPFKTESEKIEARKLSKEPEVLTVYVKLHSMNEDNVIIKIINYRPHYAQSLWRRIIGIPEAFDHVKLEQRYASGTREFDTSLSEEELKKQLNSFFKNRIY